MLLYDPREPEVKSVSLEGVTRLRLLILRGEPHAVTIGFAGLRATGLAEVGLNASLPEGNQALDVGTHRCGEANDQLEVRANAGAVGGFLHELEVAEGVGDGAGFLVEIGRGENDVGEPGGLREEHILHNEEGIAQNAGVGVIAGDGVCADDIERGLAGGGVVAAARI